MASGRTIKVDRVGVVNSNGESGVAVAIRGVSREEPIGRWIAWSAKIALDYVVECRSEVEDNAEKQNDVRLTSFGERIKCKVERTYVSPGDAVIVLGEKLLLDFPTWTSMDFAEARPAAAIKARVVERSMVYRACKAIL